VFDVGSSVYYLVVLMVKVFHFLLLKPGNFKSVRFMMMQTLPTNQKDLFLDK